MSIVLRLEIELNSFVWNEGNVFLKKLLGGVAIEFLCFVGLFQILKVLGTEKPSFPIFVWIEKMD